MAGFEEKDVLVALDIGSSKIISLAGILDNGKLRVIAPPSRENAYGIEGGKVTDITDATISIERSIEQLELMIGAKVKDVICNITGNHIKSANSRRTIGLSAGEVNIDDVNRSIETAKLIKIEEGSKILHVIPQDFSIDNGDLIQNPLGMSASRSLSINAHVISCSKRNLEQITHLLRKCNLYSKSICASALASGYAVTNKIERKNGVVVIDVGSANTDVSFFFKDKLYYTASFNIGGYELTKAISIATKIPLEKAETLKQNLEIGYQSSSPSLNEMQLEQGSEVAKQYFSEMFNRIKKEMLELKLPLDQIISGIFLTGDGAIVENIDKLAIEIFDIHAKISYPKIDDDYSEEAKYIQTPSYSTAYGLLLYAINNQLIKSSDKEQNFKNGILKNLANWLKKNF